MADRGGLSVPTEYCFAVCGLAVKLYALILSEDSVKKRFISLPNPRQSFICATINVAENCKLLAKLIVQSCDEGHRNFDNIVKITFNCCAKNEMKRLNVVNIDPPAKMSRAIRKLNSKNSTNT